MDSRNNKLSGYNSTLGGDIAEESEPEDTVLNDEIPGYNLTVVDERPVSRDVNGIDKKLSDDKKTTSDHSELNNNVANDITPKQRWKTAIIKNIRFGKKVEPEKPVKKAGIMSWASFERLYEQEEENKKSKPSWKRIKHCYYCFLTEHHPLEDDSPWYRRFIYIFMCPPHGRLAKSVTLVIIGLIFWAVFWAILGERALPGGNIFGIIWVWLMSGMFGFAAEFCHLPRLLGTLLGGILSSNVPFINFGKDIDKQWFNALKKIAIVIVLIRAGLGVDLRALWRHKFVVFRMGSVPLIVEGVAIAISTKYLLNMPWTWAFLTGYTIAPMSAAAAIPFMLAFSNAGLGINKSIPSIVQLAAVWDNILGLCLFSTFVGVNFIHEAIYITVLKLFPMQIAIGIGGGFLVGMFLWYIPHKNSKQKVLYRFIFLLGACVVGAFATRLPQFTAVGPLAVVIIVIVAAVKWKEEGWTRRKNPLIPIFSLIWIGTQIMLSGLIGALIDVSHINWKTFGIDIGVLCIGMSFRLISQLIMAQGCNLNTREKIFMVAAWIPKATVQAAVGSIAYELAIQLDLSAEEVERGKEIFILSFLAITLWACIGALCISHLGPKLLNKTMIPKRSSRRRRFDVRDVFVQTGADLLSDDHSFGGPGRRLAPSIKRKRSTYNNNSGSSLNPPSRPGMGNTALSNDPVIKGMMQIVEGFG